MNDNQIYVNKGGKLVKVGSPKAPGFRNPTTGKEHGPEERCNFLIVCSYGDWSGFRTLAKCVEQFENDPSMLSHRDDYFFSIVERL